MKIQKIENCKRIYCPESFNKSYKKVQSRTWKVIVNFWGMKCFDKTLKEISKFYKIEHWFQFDIRSLPCTCIQKLSKIHGTLSHWKNDEGVMRKILNKISKFKKSTELNVEFNLISGVFNVLVFKNWVRLMKNCGHFGKMFEVLFVWQKFCVFKFENVYKIEKWTWYQKF